MKLFTFYIVFSFYFLLCNCIAAHANTNKVDSYWDEVLKAHELFLNAELNKSLAVVDLVLDQLSETKEEPENIKTYIYANEIAGEICLANMDVECVQKYFENLISTQVPKSENLSHYWLIVMNSLIGRCSSLVGDGDNALVSLKRVLDLTVVPSGDYVRHYISAAFAIAKIYRQKGNWAEADFMAHNVLATLLNAGDVGDRDMAILLINLLAHYRETRQLKRAAKVSIIVEKYIDSLFRENDIYYVNYYHNFLWLLHDTGHYHKAAEILENIENQNKLSTLPLFYQLSAKYLGISANSLDGNFSKAKKNYEDYKTLLSKWPKSSILNSIENDQTFELMFVYSLLKNGDISSAKDILETLSENRIVDRLKPFLHLMKAFLSSGEGNILASQNRIITAFNSFKKFQFKTFRYSFFDHDILDAYQKLFMLISLEVLSKDIDNVKNNEKLSSVWVETEL